MGNSFFYSIRDYKIDVGMSKLVNFLFLRLVKVIIRYGKQYSPLDILLLKTHLAPP